MADQRVPSNDPRKHCATRSGSSSLILSKVVNEQGNLLGLIKKETEPWRDGAPLPKDFSLHSSVPLC